MVRELITSKLDLSSFEAQPGLPRPKGQGKSQSKSKSKQWNRESTNEDNEAA
jgi:hypothetical protein